MAQKMAAPGLQHKQARLAGEIKSLQKCNRHHHAKLDELTERIAANQAKIADLEAGVQTVRRAAQAGFSVDLPVPVGSRQSKAAPGALSLLEFGEATPSAPPRKEGNAVCP